MKRFFLASAFAVFGALGFAGTADAQYVYGYQTYVPGAGVVVRNQTYATPFGVQRTQGYYSPFTGGGESQSYYADAWGNQGFRTSGYNPFTNSGYQNGYSYAPSYGYNTNRFYPNNFYPTNLPAFNSNGYYYRR